MKIAYSGNDMTETGITHPFGPLYDGNSRVLILGSFPSVASREEGFFYGHPQNRFWKVIARLTGEEVPRSIPEKRQLILKHNLALWDVIACCSVTGSSDASIRDVRANDLRVILDHCAIERVFCNGRTAWLLYEKHILPVTGREAVFLPSTSPANAKWTLEKLTEAWGAVCAE